MYIVMCNTAVNLTRLSSLFHNPVQFVEILFFTNTYLPSFCSRVSKFVYRYLSLAFTAFKVKAKAFQFHIWKSGTSKLGLKPNFKNLRIVQKNHRLTLLVNIFPLTVMQGSQSVKGNLLQPLKDERRGNDRWFLQLTETNYKDVQVEMQVYLCRSFPEILKIKRHFYTFISFSPFFFSVSDSR